MPFVDAIANVSSPLAIWMRPGREARWRVAIAKRQRVVQVVYRRQSIAATSTAGEGEAQSGIRKCYYLLEWPRIGNYQSNGDDRRSNVHVGM
jgi:hypothetical protein